MKRRQILVVAVMAALAVAIPISGAAADDGWEMEGLVDDDVAGAPLSYSQVVYDMIFPVAGDNNYTDTFGACRGNGCSRRHEGIDIMADKMVPVVAVAAGTIGWVHDERSGKCCAFALDHDDGWESYYIHLNNDTPGTDDGDGWGFAPGITRGARVEAGQLLGWVGDSGNAEWTGSHLHYELHEPDGTVVNPFPSLEAATRLDAPRLGDGPRNCDFDADGYGDLAVGSPGKDLGGGAKPDAGAVTILFGAAGGLGTDGATVFKQSSPGVASATEADDRFGETTACGDFDGDGHGDLVIGVPGEDFGEKVDVGAVNVLYGSDEGLAPREASIWHQGKPGVGSDNGAGDRFGAALTVADFNGDGYDDVAVGAPGETLRGLAAAGRVAVFYGSAAGLTGDSAGFSEGGSAVPGGVEAGDQFGAALAAGDFDLDGYDDLAVGIPGEDAAAGADVGAVVVFPGGASGLTKSGAMRLKQGARGIAGNPYAGDAFGAALAAGDSNGDLAADLAVGVPGDAAGAAVGAVNMIYGSESGLSGSGDLLLRAGSGGVPGTPAAGARFGASVAMGDFNLDGHRDLVIGVPGAAGAAGSVIVIPSLWDGLVLDDAEVLSEGQNGMPGAAASGDEFGRWVATGTFDALGYSALVVGVPGEDHDGKADAGAVTVVVGGPAGLDGAAGTIWRQSSSGVPGAEAAGDGWGRVVRAGV